jgi:CDP-glucose 4,6-dehydratase
MVKPSRAFWQDRPTFVTGATGLVGAWLARRLLDAGAEVVCLVRDWVPNSEMVRTSSLEQVTVVRGDVCDLALLERVLNEYEINTVIHLAAQTIVGTAQRNPISTFETNIRGTWALLEASRRSPLVRQIIVASSDKAYGDCNGNTYEEGNPLAGRHPYDVSKSCADLIAQSYARTYQMPVIITRCGNFYGGGDLNWNRIVPGTIRSLIRGERPIVRSDGQFIRDYFYVEDGAAAYMLLAECLASNPSLRGRAFNFSNETPLTVLEVVEKIQKTLGIMIDADIRNEASHEIRSQRLSAAAARRDLGWRPLYTFEEGLKKTSQWYRKFFEDSASRHV